MPLKDILRGLLAKAGNAHGEATPARLAKGLQIKIKVVGQIVAVQLARDGVVPSMREWKTVLDCWPEPYSLYEEPKELQPINGRHFLRGKLRRQMSLLKEENKQ